MTLQEIQKLTDDELRVRVAELAGAKWQEVPPRDGYSYRPKRLLSFHTWDFDSPRCAPLPFPNQQGDAYSGPNYPADLNACAEFERTLTKIQRQDYAGELRWATKAEFMEEDAEVFVVAHASARQRCEAFLATMTP